MKFARAAICSTIIVAVLGQDCPCYITGSYCQFGDSGCPFQGTCHGNSSQSCSCDNCGVDINGKSVQKCQPCGGGPSPGPAPMPPPSDDKFRLWADPPGSAYYRKLMPKWYDLIAVRRGQNFSSYLGSRVDDDSHPSSLHVEVNMAQHGAIHLFADPSFQQSFDNKIRHWNNKWHTHSGTVDRCQWPLQPGHKAPLERQTVRRTTPLVEDFSQGLQSDRFVIALQKGCCKENKTDPSGNKFQRNLFIDTDVVNGESKNVLVMRAWNADDPHTCKNHTSSDGCFKEVTSSGTIASADLFASGRYEVVAKVPAASGLIWAVWTFHFENHLPSDCASHTCWCKDMPDVETASRAGCEFHKDPASGDLVGCVFDNLCHNYTDGWSPAHPHSPTEITPEQCGQQAHHHQDDPQFLGSHSFGGWMTTVNHEIDMEIPANCEGTHNVCNNSNKTCARMYNSINLNNYQYTQNSGTGPAYSNMCVRAYKRTTKHGGGHYEPFPLLGDGHYHNYTFNWHTGSDKEPGHVDFFVDGQYLGTNNVFSPTRAGRLFIAHWPSNNKRWNDAPNDWGGGHPGDGLEHSIETRVSLVRITPFNEKNDLVYPATFDQPDGCVPNFMTPNVSSAVHCHRGWEAYDIPP